MRVRLFRHPGVQDVARRGLPHRPGQFQSGDDHDRPGHGRSHLYRADHPGDRRQDHRQGAPRHPRRLRAAADHGRPDGAQLRAVAQEDGRARTLRRRDDRRDRQSDRQGRGPPVVPRGDDPHRPRDAALAPHQDAAAGAGGARRHRPAGDHPPELHVRGHRRRHRLQQARVHRDRRARHRRLADQRGADRRERARLEGIRDGGRPRQGGQLHHRLLDRERRSDGRAHRRFDHHRPGADADRQGIPGHARRLDRGAARDRRRDRRLQRAVRDQSGRRPHDRHRDEPARVALLGPGVEGDRLSDRQGRRQAGGRLPARRDRQRHHRRRDAGFVRADDRLHRHQDPALRLREVPRRRAGADDGDEVGRRGDGDRPHLRRIAAEGAALDGDGPHRSRRSRDRRPRQGRRPQRPARGDRHADARSAAEGRAGDAPRHERRRDLRGDAHRLVVPRAGGGDHPPRGQGAQLRPAARRRQSAAA